MIFRFTKMFTFFVAVFIALAYSSFASSDEMLVIRPTPNKSACKSSALRIGEDSVKSELCVLQGNFSHDKYVLKFSGDTVLQGIDDQTTPGIQANHKGKPIVLRCPPQNVPPNATAAEIQKIVPGYSTEKAKEVAELMVGSILPIEAGRLCQVSVDGEAVMTVQVLFD
ncbi:hypothetical protein [Aquitalea magnusonii]|uniref:hypothetical protein n=1 Tax=Aquitalea magnusonii TaxID=332411 RepID=UPI000B5C69A3|nr:hypothetical protein [Aquitalea magnusonii]